MTLRILVSALIFISLGLPSCDVHPNTGHQIYHSNETTRKTKLITYKLTASSSYIDIGNRIQKARVRHYSKDNILSYHACHINRVDENTLIIEVGPIKSLLDNEKYLLEYTFDGSYYEQ